MKRALFLSLPTLLAALVLSGCNEVKGFGAAVVIPTSSHTTVVTTQSGPPPHAPAHGYRHHHHHGVDLVFDTGLGVYLVADMNDLFFHNDLYIRFYDSRWQVSAKLDGPWHAADEREVPLKLKKAKGPKKPHPGRGKAKGHDKHKDKWR